MCSKLTLTTVTSVPKAIMRTLNRLLLAGLLVVLSLLITVSKERLGAYAKMRLLSRRRALDDKGRRGSGGSSLPIRIQIQPRYSWSTLARKASTPKTSFQSHSRSRLRKSWASWIPSMSDGVGEHCAWRACRPILIGGCAGR